jgi:hypothetical protein
MTIDPPLTPPRRGIRNSFHPSQEGNKKFFVKEKFPS